MNIVVEEVNNIKPKFQPTSYADVERECAAREVDGIWFSDSSNPSDMYYVMGAEGAAVNFDPHSGIILFKQSRDEEPAWEYLTEITEPRKLILTIP